MHGKVIKSPITSIVGKDVTVYIEDLFYGDLFTLTVKNMDIVLGELCSIHIEGDIITFITTEGEIDIKTSCADKYERILEHHGLM